MKIKLFIIPLLIIILLAIGGILSYLCWQSSFVEKSAELMTIPEEYVALEIIFAPDGKQIAYRAYEKDAQDKGWFVGVGDTKGKTYKSVSNPVFSPDSQKVAYIVDQQEKRFVVINKEEGKSYDNILGSVVFSSDSRRTVYIAYDIQEEKKMVVVDEEEGEFYDNVFGGPIFLSDNKTTAYLANQGREWFLVVGDEEQKHYDMIRDYSTSPDSQKIVYAGLREDIESGGKWFIVLWDSKDKQQHLFGGEYDFVADPVFSPDSQKVAYVVVEKGEFFVVVEDIIENSSNRIKVPSVSWVGNLTFAPDSAKIAYIGKRQNKEFVAVSNKEGKIYDGIVKDYLSFSPDSQRVAYVVNQQEKQFIVVDDKEGKHYDKIYKPSFSPDSVKIAYKVVQNGEMFAVVNSKEGKHYDTIRNIVFSPNSKNIIYVSIGGENKEFVVVNGREGEPHDSIRSFFGRGLTFLFTPDKNQVEYGARDDNDLRWINRKIK